jgi:hypothetical protein
MSFSRNKNFFLGVVLTPILWQDQGIRKSGDIYGQV